MIEPEAILAAVDSEIIHVGPITNDERIHNTALYAARRNLVAALAANPAAPAPASCDYSVAEIAAKIADRVPHADLDGFSLSERLRIGSAVAPLFQELIAEPAPVGVEITDAAEAIARSMFEAVHELDWSQAEGPMRAEWLERGRAALEAARPALDAALRRAEL